MEPVELKKLEGKNWLAALTLCWALGIWGAHRFYTGKTTSGWVLAVMTLIGLGIISWIISVIDGISIVMGKYTHEDGGELYEKIDWVGILYIVSLILSVIIFILVTCLILVAGIGIFSGLNSAIPPVVQ